MALRRPTRRQAGVTAAVLLAGAIVVATADHWMAWWWGRQAERPLTVAQATAVAACADPGTEGTLRVFWQGLDAPCSPVTVAAWAVRARTRPGVRRWWRSVWQEEPPDPRTALRLELVAWLEGQPVAATLPARLQDPRLPEPEASWGLLAVARGEVDGAWVDPVLRHRAVALSAAHGALSDLPRLRDALAGATVADGLLGGVDGPALAASLVERLAGLGDPDGSRFSCVGADDCVAVARDAVTALLAQEAEGWDGGGVAGPLDPEPAPVPLADALWAAGGGPGTLEDGRRLVAEVAAWVGRQEDPAAAVLAAVASPFGGYGIPEAAAGELGDPADVLGRRAGSPWATAVAAMAIGARVGVEVSAAPAGEDVVVTVGTRRVRVGPCGRTTDTPVSDGVTPRQAVARAAMEWAGAAVARDDQVTARRLAALAERSDPVWARGAAASIAPVDGPGTDLGVRIGGLAEASETWAAWAEARRRADALSCPTLP